MPGYQTIIVKRTSRAVALVLRENASSLPGVVVEQDYQRRYPLSERGAVAFTYAMAISAGVDEVRPGARQPGALPG